MFKLFKHFIPILLSITLSIRAAEQKIPKLQEWSRLCQSQIPFCNMQGLSSFILEKNSQPFEDNCRNNRIVTWALAKIIIDKFKKTLRTSSLNKEAQWIKLENYDFRSVNQLTDLFAYTIGCNVASDTKVLIWGDRHGDARSLPLGLEELQKQGVMSKKDGWKVKKGSCLIVLGDYINNGPYSLEAILTTMILKIKNANNERVFLLRGNHENINHSATNDWTIKQAALSFEQDLGPQKAQKAAIKMVKVFQEKLPVALFLGTRNAQTGQGNYLFITHAAPDLGYNPAALFKILETTPDNQLVYHPINPMIYKRPHPDNTNASSVISEHLKENYVPYLNQYLATKRDSSNTFDLGFLKDWTLNDEGRTVLMPFNGLPFNMRPFTYFQSYTLPFYYYHEAGMTFTWGKPLIQALFKDWSNDKSTVIAMVRGHQHTHEGDKRRDPNLVYRMHQLWMHRGMIYEWQEKGCPIDGPHFLKPGETYTLNVAPDSWYGCPESTVTGQPHNKTMYPGFNYDTIGKFTLSENPHCWTTNIINIKSFEQKPHSFMYDNYLVTPQI